MDNWKGYKSPFRRPGHIYICIYRPSEFAVVIVNLFLDLLGYEDSSTITHSMGTFQKVADTDFTFIDKTG